MSNLTDHPQLTSKREGHDTGRRLRPAAVLYPEISDFLEEGICVRCGSPVQHFKDELSAREYYISGLCQACQDRIFPTAPEEVPDHV